MSKENSTTIQSSEKEFVISRTFNAPRELVFKVWTDAEHLQHWWGPKDFTIETIDLDPRPGGFLHFKMQSPEGHETWGKFVYHEIVAPNKIVFVNSFSDAKGNVIRAPFSATWPLEVSNTVTLSEKDGKTTLTLRGYPINATEEEYKTYREGFESMKQGFGGTFDQLEEYLGNV